MRFYLALSLVFPKFVPIPSAEEPPETAQTGPRR